MLIATYIPIHSYCTNMKTFSLFFLEYQHQTTKQLSDTASSGVQSKLHGDGRKRQIRSKEKNISAGILALGLVQMSLCMWTRLASVMFLQWELFWIMQKQSLDQSCPWDEGKGHVLMHALVISCMAYCFPKPKFKK